MRTTFQQNAAIGAWKQAVSFAKQSFEDPQLVCRIEADRSPSSLRDLQHFAPLTQDCVLG